jgi:hypothetical protein
MIQEIPILVRPEYGNWFLGVHCLIFAALADRKQPGKGMTNFAIQVDDDWSVLGTLEMSTS